MGGEFSDILDDLEDLTDVNMIINHVGFIEDHSGSMGGSEKQAMKQFNEQLNQMKEKTRGQKTFLTKTCFSDFINFDVDNEPIEQVGESTNYPLYGSTKLYDAIGMTINKIEANMRKHPSDNQAALIIIITDGGENDSQEFNGPKLKERVEELEKQGNWTFTILGADFDIFKEMKKTGIVHTSTLFSNALSFNKNARGYKFSTDTLKKGVDVWYTARATGQMSVNNLYEEKKDEDDESDNCSVTDPLGQRNSGAN